MTCICSLPWLVLRQFSTFPTTKPSVAFQLNGSFVSENNVKEAILVYSFVEMLCRPLKTLSLILLSYHLAVGTAPKRPAQRLSTP